MCTRSHSPEHIEGHSYHLRPHRLTELFVFVDLVLFSDVGGCSECCPVGAFQFGWSDWVDHGDITEETLAIEVEE